MTHRTLSTIMLLAICLCAPSSGLTQGVSEKRFMWKEAFSRMSAAHTPEDFNAAAQIYQKLVDSGVRNGPLFYNLGTALLMAKKCDDALIPLSRAERYMGNTWEIERNMLIAAAGEDRDDDVSLPWYRAPLFWHFGLATSVRLNIAVSAFAAFWLCLSLRTLGLKRFLRPLTVLALIVFVIFASSAIASFYAEHRASATMVTRPEMEDLS